MQVGGRAAVEVLEDVARNKYPLEVGAACKSQVSPASLTHYRPYRSVALVMFQFTTSRDIVVPTDHSIQHTA